MTMSAYYGLSSASAVSTLFDTSSNTYSLLRSCSDYSNYKTLNSVVNNLKSNLINTTDDTEKSSIQERLDTILEGISASAPTESETTTLYEQATEQAESLLSSMGLGTSIDTLA